MPTPSSQARRTTRTTSFVDVETGRGFRPGQLSIGGHMEAIFVKATQDGRKVEVINGWLCLAGAQETDTLIPLIEHPNRQAISKAVPGATHMAGRIPLRHDEAAVAQGALDAARREFSTDPIAINERFRKNAWMKAALEGIE